MLAAAAPAFAADPPVAVDLSVYVGKHPLDPVNGVAFLRHPRVRAAVEAAVPDARIRAWILRRAARRTPIALRGGAISSWGCEANNCNDRNWSIYIDPSSRLAEICYHHESSMADYSMWFSARERGQLRPTHCLSE
jgi:hypothetical protein